MKFKLFSAVLLLVCFVFLGVLTGAIPVTELSADAAASFFARLADPDGPDPTDAPTPAPDEPASVPAAAQAAPARSAALPAAATAPAHTPTLPPIPTPTAPPDPTDAPTPEPTDEPSPASTDEPALEPTDEPAPAPTDEPAPEPTDEPSPAPTDEPAPEPTDEPASTAAPDPDAAFWEPSAAVISTTITWNDPLKNETDYSVDGEALLGLEPDLVLPAEGYQVLIIHTHGTEAYTPDGEDRYAATSDYRTTDPEHSILRVGQALGQALERYGLNVLVDTGLYDWPNYDSAYARSAEAIQAHLDEDPSIRVVIDLHRDALGDDATVYKTVSDQVRPDAAQLMFVVGTDVTLPHPNWRENLAFAMSLQGLLEEQYPHLMRPTLLSRNRYNQQMTASSILLEIGTAGNTLQEAVTSAELFAEVVGPALAARIEE